MESYGIENRNFEVRASEDNTISGYAIVVNSPSVDLGGFTEIIEPSALTEDLINKSDVRALLNHNDSKGILARSRNGKGSLHLGIDEKGLQFSFNCPDTELGREVRYGIQNEIYTQCSFAFAVDKDRWEKKDDGSYVRHIESFKFLRDVSIVADPAYPETTVSCRSFDEFKEKEAEELRRLKEAEAEEQRKAELKAYFEELRSKIN